MVLTAWFPQDRIAFLGLLALWGGLCAFAATVLRNFASYSAALAGYTAAIIAADTLGATGGASSDVFMLAVARASEICIGIVCAGVILAGTDFGGAQRRLAASFANLAAEIVGGFSRMLALAGPQLPDTQTERREFVRRVIALDPMIDQALGESSHVRYHSLDVADSRPRPVQSARWLARSCDASEPLAGGHGSASRRKLSCAAFRPSCDRRESQARRHAGWLIPWPCAASARRRCGRCSPCRPARHRCGCSPTRQPRCCPAWCACSTGWRCSSMLLTNLLLDHRGFRLSVPDWLPALVNAARAFVTIGAVELFWVVTAWPNGASAMVFVTIVVLLLSPKGRSRLRRRHRVRARHRR